MFCISNGRLGKQYRSVQEELLICARNGAPTFPFTWEGIGQERPVKNIDEEERRNVFDTFFSNLEVVRSSAN